MTQLERAQNILRLHSKCQPPRNCGTCEIYKACEKAGTYTNAIYDIYDNIDEDGFAAIINRMDAKWRPANATM
jgi:hypothetical protein